MPADFNDSSAVRFCLILGFIVLNAGHVQSAEPLLNGISPSGFQRGTEVVVQFTGARLADAGELMLYSPGVTVTELKPADEKRIDVKLTVAPDCRLGFHAVRIRTASGISNLRTFSVGPLKEIQEKEPNSDFDQPQTVEMDSTISGVVLAEDVDYFIVTAKKGERINVEIEGVRLGNNTFFDPFIAILDANRFELARSDDAPLLQQDCLCGIVAPEDGQYIVQVRESAFGGNGNCKYRLHVGRFPRPAAVLPTGGQPGQQIQLTWIGDVAGDFESTVTLPTELASGLASGPASDFGLYAQDTHGIAPSANMIRIDDLANVLEVEPNDARDKSQVITVPAAISGRIERPGDVDYFKFSAKKGQVYDLRVVARQLLRSPLDAVISVTRSKGAGVGGNDDSGGPDSYLRFTAPDDDDYLLAIHDQLRDGGPAFVYRIEIAPVTRSLELKLPERTQYVPLTISVPQGNRMAVMVNATRRDFGGDLDVSFAGLPPGITADPVMMAARLSSVPVLMTAAVDAAPGGALVDLIGSATDEKLNVVGHLKQRTMLVRGQNNRDVWGHDADRVAVAVTEKVPFTINLIEPKVPIVRNGAMQLEVQATRDEGFNEAISLSLLYNPPGIGSSGSVAIPAGKNKVAIPLTANGKAQIGVWPIVVVGRAKVGNGVVLVASGMANLDVSETFFNLVFEKSSAELKQQAEVLVRIEQKKEFDGAATVRLLGLPAKTSTDAEPIGFTKDSTDVVFKVDIDEAAKPGKYQTLVCQAIVTQHGEPITHTFGSGELRIDKPLPPKPDKPKAETVVEKKPVVEKKTKKRLSRLEQLRLERKK